MRLVVTALSLAMLTSGCGGAGHSASLLPAGSGSANDAIERTVVAVSPARGDDWPTFARDVQRQSYESLPTGITQQTVTKLKNLWTFKTSDGKGFDASPIVVNGVVYVVNINGVVNALDAKTGLPKWAAPYQIPDSSAVKMTPALYDGKLFVASWQTAYADTNYYFAALDPLTGHQLWITKLPGGVHGSPVAIGGIIYVPVAIGDPGYCHPGGVYALDENTGTLIGKPWLTDPAATTPDGGGIWSSLTYDGAQFYYGTGNTCRNTIDTSNAILGLTPGATSANWNVTTANSLLDDDVGGSVLRVGHSAFAIGKNGWIYHINALTGQIVWSRSLGALDGAGGFATPSYYGSGTNGTLITGAGYIYNPDTHPGLPGGRLYGLRENGSVRWEVTSNEPVLGSVAVTPDLAFTPLDTSVDALDPLTGNVLWKYPSVGYFYASPAIVPSGLFVADESGRVYAFGLPSSGTMSSALSPAAILQLQQREHPQIHLKPKFCKPSQAGPRLI